MIQDQAGAAIAAHGVTGAAKSAAHSAATTAEQKAAALRGEVSNVAAGGAGGSDAAHDHPVRRSGRSRCSVRPRRHDRVGHRERLGVRHGGLRNRLRHGRRHRRSGHFRRERDGDAAATVEVAPPAAVDVRGSGSATLGH